MWNCVIVTVNNRKQGVFPDMDKAEMYRQLMQQQFAHLNLTIYCDWGYIPDLVW